MKHVFKIFILLSFFFCGCATTHNQTQQINSFAVAASSIADETIKTYEVVRDTTLEAELIELAMLEQEELKAIDQEKIDGISGVYAIEEKQVIESLNALKEYSEALIKLCNASVKEDLSVASKEFHSSLESLSDAYDNISDKGLEIKDKHFAMLSSLVNGVGNVIVESKRKKAIKEIVRKTNPAIIKLCDLIAERVVANVDIVKVNIGTVYAEMISDYKDNAEKMSVSTRMKELKELRKYSNRNKEIEKVFNNAKTAVLKVKSAHQALYDSLMLDKMSTAKLKDEVKRLSDFGKEMKKFYKNILAD